MLGLFIGYVLFEVVQGGLIGLVCDGDIIEIDILNCIINFVVFEVELDVCCIEQNWLGWKLVQLCKCNVMIVLKVYVVFVVFVDKGVVCILLE